MTKSLKISLILVVFLLNSGCSSFKGQRSQKELKVEDYSKLYDNGEFKRNDLYFKSSAAMLSGDYEKANKVFETLVKLEPKNMYIKKKYAISLIKASKIKESKKYLDEVFRASKFQDDQIGLILAGVHTSLGESKEARATYKRILALNPSHQEACVFLGKSYALNKQKKKAQRQLEACSRKIKGKGIFDYFIGKIYVEGQDLDKALFYFKRSLEKEPSYAQAALGVGLIYEEQKKNKKAVKFYKDFLEKNEDKMILERLVSLFFVQQKFEEVIPYAEKLSDMDSSNLNLRVKLGILYTDTKKYDKAIGIFKSLVRISPDNDKLLYYLGAIYQEIDEYENAIEYYSLIHSESGLYPDSSLQVAQMLMKLAKQDQSKEEKFISYINKKYSELPRISVELKVTQANYFDHKGQFDLAIDSLKSIEKNPNFSLSHKFFLATLYEKEKKFNQAYGIMDRILLEDKDNAHALNFIGYSLVERELEMDKAYTYLKKAIELKPEDGYIRDSLGWYYYKVGKIDKALKELKKASQQVKDDASILKHLAVVYSKLKKFKLAKKYLVDAIKLTNSQKLKKEMQEALKEVETQRFPASFK